MINKIKQLEAWFFNLPEWVIVTVAVIAGLAVSVGSLFFVALFVMLAWNEVIVALAGGTNTMAYWQALIITVTIALVSSIVSTRGKE